MLKLFAYDQGKGLRLFWIEVEKNPYPEPFYWMVYWSRKWDFPLKNINDGGPQLRILKKKPDSQVWMKMLLILFQEVRELKYFLILNLSKNREDTPKSQICLDFRHI